MLFLRKTHRAYLFVYFTLSAWLRSVNDDGAVAFRASCFMLGAEMLIAIEILALINKMTDFSLPAQVPYIPLAIGSAGLVVFHNRMTSKGSSYEQYAHQFQHMSKSDHRRWVLTTWAAFLTVVAATVLSSQYLRPPPLLPNKVLQSTSTLRVAAPEFER